MRLLLVRSAGDDAELRGLCDTDARIRRRLAVSRGSGDARAAISSGLRHVTDPQHARADHVQAAKITAASISLAAVTTLLIVVVLG